MDKASTSASARKAAKSQSQDAIALLSADHRKVEAMFEQYEELKESGDSEEKAALAAQICLELTVHAKVEEEIFYPAAREALEEQNLLDEAEVEHATAKDLIEQIQSMDPTDELYDAKVKVLGEYVSHHVQEEEEEIFPRCQSSEMDLEGLAEELHARREELLEELGMSGDE